MSGAVFYLGFTSGCLSVGGGAYAVFGNGDAFPVVCCLVAGLVVGSLGLVLSLWADQKLQA